MRKPTALLVTLGLTVAGLSVGTVPTASAEEPCAFIGPAVTGDYNSDWSDGVVVVGVTATRTAYFNAWDTTDGCGTADMDWTFEHAGEEPGYATLTNDHSDDEFSVFGYRDLAPYYLSNSWAGAQHDTAQSSADSSIVAEFPTYYIKRETRLTTNASPEPVRKGRTITIRGSLIRASWDDLAYHHYGSQKVILEFRSPTGSYHRVKAVTAHSDGTIKTTQTAGATGVWRFTYPGNSTSGASVAKGDSVKVTR